MGLGPWRSVSNSVVGSVGDGALPGWETGRPGGTMEPISWSTSIQAAEWIGRALTAARNREQQRFARLIEHAGTIVAGLRAIDREAHSIFLPMFYTDIRAWPEEQRREWIQRIITLAHEDRITSALRISLFALRDLETQQSDGDVARFLRMITDVTRGPIAGAHSGAVGVSMSAGVTGAMDVSIQGVIDCMLEALENPESWSIDQKKNLLRSFVISERNGNDLVADGDALILLNATGDTVTTLRPYADKAEEILGKLLALQHRIFPDLPTPVWIWQPE